VTDDRTKLALKTVSVNGERRITTVFCRLLSNEVFSQQPDENFAAPNRRALVATGSVDSTTPRALMKSASGSRRRESFRILYRLTHFRGKRWATVRRAFSAANPPLLPRVLPKSEIEKISSFCRARRF